MTAPAPPWEPQLGVSRGPAPAPFLSVSRGGKTGKSVSRKRRRPRPDSHGPFSCAGLPAHCSRPGEQGGSPWQVAGAVLPTPVLVFGRETLKREEEEEKQQLSHPAHFGPRKYCLRECICEVEGQVPCPSLVPLPKEMRGKYKAALRAAAKD